MGQWTKYYLFTQTPLSFLYTSIITRVGEFKLCVFIENTMKYQSVKLQNSCSLSPPLSPLLCKVTFTSSNSQQSHHIGINEVHTISSS